MESSLLAGWDNFYVIAGGAAGGLTGLTFIVITLAADAHRVAPAGVKAFVTPTIVHFGTVLALAAYLSMPRHTVLSLSIGLGVVSLGGLVYALASIAAVRVNTSAVGPEPGTATIYRLTPKQRFHPMPIDRFCYARRHRRPSPSRDSQEELIGRKRPY